MKKKIVGLLLTVSMLITMLSICAGAAGILDGAVILKVGVPYAAVNGTVSQIDAGNAAVVPVIQDSRTLVPVRFIAEGFNAGVDWIAETQTVIVDKYPWTIRIIIGDTDYNLVSSTQTKTGEMDVPAMIIDGRTMVPLRFIAETLEKKVFWDNRGLIIISDEDISSTIDEATIVKAIDSLTAANLGKTVDFSTAAAPAPSQPTVSGTPTAPDVTAMELIDHLDFEERPAGLTYADSFLTDEKAYTGEGSIKFIGDCIGLSKSYSKMRNGVVTIMVYDHGDLAHNMAIYVVVGEDVDDMKGIGVSTGMSRDCYVYRFGKETVATNIKRSEGWHKFTFDYSSGDGGDYFIDDQWIAHTDESTMFNNICINDSWSDNTISNFFFDDIRVYE